MWVRVAAMRLVEERADDDGRQIARQQPVDLFVVVVDRIQVLIVFTELISAADRSLPRRSSDNPFLGGQRTFLGCCLISAGEIGTPTKSVRLRSLDEMTLCLSSARNGA